MAIAGGALTSDHLNRAQVSIGSAAKIAVNRPVRVGRLLRSVRIGQNRDQQGAGSRRRLPAWQIQHKHTRLAVAPPLSTALGEIQNMNRVLLACLLGFFLSAQAFESDVDEARQVAERALDALIAAEGEPLSRERALDLSWVLANPDAVDPELLKTISAVIEPATQTTATAKGSSGVIRGRVRSATDGTVIQSADVTLYDAAGRYVSRRTADGAGRYVFNGLVPGDYYVHAAPYYYNNVNGYFGVLYDGVLCPNGVGSSCTVDDGAPVTVADGLVDSIDFALPEGARIQGRVTDRATGVPLNGYARLYDEAGDVVQTEQYFDGQYSLGGLAAGSYRLYVYGAAHKGHLHGAGTCDLRSDGGCDLLSGMLITVDLNTRLIPDIQLDRFGSLSGSLMVGAVVPFHGSVQAFRISDGDEVANAPIDQNGRWVFPALPDVTVAVTASTTGYPTKLYDDVDCPGSGSCDLSLGLPILVPLGAAVSDIDFSFPASGSITGIVTRESTGEPLAGVRIRLRGDTGSSAVFSLGDGSYTFTGLAPGDYRLYSDTYQYQNELWNGRPCAGGGGSSCNYQDGDVVTVVSGVATSGIDFDLADGPTVTGLVVDEVGQPISDVRVCAYQSYSLNFDVQCTLTQADGSYHLQGLPTQYEYLVGAQAQSGPYESQVWNGVDCGIYFTGCEPSEGTVLTLGENESRSGVNFALRPLATVSGTMLSGGNVARYERVSFYNATTGNFLTSVSTDQQGEYSIALVPGQYHALARDSGFLSQLYDGVDCGSQCDFSTATTITLASGESRNDVDFSLRRYATIEGFVRDTSGRTLRNANVSVWNTAGEFVTRSYTNSGGFQIGVAPGTYFVSAQLDGYRGQLFDGVECTSICEPLRGTPLVVTSESTVTIDFDLTALEVFSGRVTDRRDGGGVAGATVSIFREGTSYSYHHVRTDDEGFYQFIGLPAGNYHLLATGFDHYGRAWFDQSCVQDCEITTTDVVTVVGAGVQTGFDFALYGKTVVSGSVVKDEDGAPIRYADISVLSPSGAELTRFQTGEDGTFQFNALNPGAYYLRTSDYERVSLLYDNIECDLNCDPVAAGGTLITVGESVAQVGPLTFSMKTRGSVTGTVVSASDQRGIGDVVVNAASNGQFVRQTQTNINGQFQISGLPSGSYQISFNHPYYADEVFQDIICDPSGCDPAAGALVTVTAATVTNLGMVDLTRLGSIAGQVTDTRGAVALGAAVELWNDRGRRLQTYTIQPDGSYQFNGLLDGDYFVFFHGDDFLSEVYNNIPCPSGLLTCDLDAASRVTLVGNAQIVDVDATVERIARTRIEVELLDRVSGAGVGQGRVFFLDSDGRYVTRASTSYSTSLVSVELEPGSYFVVGAADGYQPIAWPDADCDMGSYYSSPPDCDLFQSTFVTVAPAETTEVAIALPLVDGLSGYLYSTELGTSLVGSAIDVWRDDGQHVAGLAVGADGSFSTRLNDGAYYVSTDNGYGLVDRVYRGVECLDGPAIQGLCDVTDGTLLLVPSLNNQPHVLQIDLTVSSNRFFADGFETRAAKTAVDTEPMRAAEQ